MSVKNFLITIICCFGFYLYQGSKKDVSKSFSSDLQDPALREETLAEMEEGISRVMKNQKREIASSKETPQMTMEEVSESLDDLELDDFSGRSELIKNAQNLNQPSELEKICFSELEHMANLEKFQGPSSHAPPMDRHIHQVLTSLSTTMEPWELNQELERMMEDSPSPKMKQVLEIYLLNSQPLNSEVP